MQKNSTKYPIKEYIFLYEEKGMSILQLAKLNGKIGTSYLGKLLKQHGCKMREPHYNHNSLRISNGFTSTANKLGIHGRLYTRYLVIKKWGSKCQICAEADWRVLQLNHIDGEGRKNKIKHADYTKILLGVYEGPKLDLRCANCNIRYEYERGHRRNYKELI